MGIIDGRIPAKPDVQRNNGRRLKKIRAKTKLAKPSGHVKPRKKRRKAASVQHPGEEVAASSSGGQNVSWVKEAIREEDKYVFFGKQQELRNAEKSGQK